MRVRVFRARAETPCVQIGETDQWLRVFPLASAAGTVVLRGPLQVCVESDRWSIVDEDSRRAPVENLDGLDIASLADAGPVVRLNERFYPGSLRLVARTDQGPEAFDVINLVPLEAYLPGVVSAELFDHWHLQTRAAQAIAARSFACSEHTLFRGRRAYDVTNTAVSQVYIGRVKHDDTLDAVRTTRGQVLAYAGALVPGYYSSCCGGLAARAVDVIGDHPANDVVPLDGREGEDICTAVKVANWTIQRPVEMLTRRLIAYGNRRNRDDLAELATIASIEVAEVNSHQRPTRYAVTDVRAHRMELGAETFMRAANYDQGQGLSPPKQSLMSSYVSAIVNESTVIFNGHGLGHGAGMCQYGAEQLARSGTSHRDIVAWYYPQALIVQAYT
ncbi:MAG: SpoIID/LytB domain-containing protein [Phycisphaerales bacterium]